jgi:ribonuclease D
VGQVKNLKRSLQLDYELIETPSDLAEFARAAEKADIVAVDLEADSMFHYRERVCLVQMAAAELIVVIDPLKLPDLSELKPLFADPGILKVFHGADYDVRSLYRDFGITIENLFDTQLASMYLGYTETSLEAVVAQRFDVVLDKKYQKKDWSRRPLPPEMIEYAASDARYLIPLAEALIEELQAKSRLSWVREGSRLLSLVRHHENHQALFLRFRGAGRLTPLQLATLEELLQLRDAIARQKDRPLFKIMSNAALLRIATVLPTSIKALTACNALSHRQIDMYGPYVVAAVERALAMPSARLPRYPRQRTQRLSPRIPRRVKALREWRDQIATELALDPSLLLNKSLIREIATCKPRTIEELRNVPQIHSWQVEAFGEQILTVLSPIP